MKFLPPKSIFFLVFYLFISVLICGAWPTGITTPMSSSLPVRTDLALDDFSGTSNIQHIAVGNTDSNGNYKIYLAFTEQLEIPGQIIPNEAFFAERSNNDPYNYWNIIPVKDFQIKLGELSAGYGFICGTMTTDNNNNAYLTVFGDDCGAYSSIGRSYMLIHRPSDPANLWESFTMWDESFRSKGWAVAGNQHIANSVSQNGAYTIFSTHFAPMPSMNYWCSGSMWLGKVWGGVHSLSGSKTENWERVLLGGYDFPSYQYISSACVVSNSGKGLMVGHLYQLDNLPINNTTDAAAGLNFGVGYSANNSWSFARLTGTGSDLYQYQDQPNHFSLAPYVNETAGGIVYLVFRSYNRTLEYRCFNLNSPVAPGSWGNSTRLATPGADQNIFDPQITFYKASSGQTFLIIVYDVNYYTGDPPVWYKSRVNMTIWDVTNPSSPTHVVDPFEVAPDEQYLGLENYYQSYPNVCVEKTLGGESDFDINVCWTNHTGIYIVTDPPPPHPNDWGQVKESDVYYRCLHFTPSSK